MRIVVFVYFPQFLCGVSVNYVGNNRTLAVKNCIPTYSKGEHMLPLLLLAISGGDLRCYFFTPVYSSTVFDVIVVVVFVLSPTCVYVAVVLMVRHALHEVMPALIATQTIATNTKINFLMLSRFLVNKINDLLLAEGAHKNASRAMFGLCTGVYANAAPFRHSAHQRQDLLELG